MSALDRMAAKGLPYERRVGDALVRRRDRADTNDLHARMARKLYSIETCSQGATLTVREVAMLCIALRCTPNDLFLWDEVTKS